MPRHENQAPFRVPLTHHAVQQNDADEAEERQVKDESCEKVALCQLERRLIDSVADSTTVAQSLVQREEKALVQLVAHEFCRVLRHTNVYQKSC